MRIVRSPVRCMTNVGARMTDSTGRTSICEFISTKARTAFGVALRTRYRVHHWRYALSCSLLGTRASRPTGCSPQLLRMSSEKAAYSASVRPQGYSGDARDLTYEPKVSRAAVRSG